MRSPFQLFSIILFGLFATTKLSAQSISYSDLYTNSTFTKTIDLANPVGSISGAAGTSPSGASTYTIPIQCPPGTNGMVPNLSIVYNSQGGNGILGQGWNLAGLSAITRAGWDEYHHAKVAPVSYQSLAPYTVPTSGGSSYVFEKSDAFVLDGSYLYPKSGVYGANATTYNTEAESYSITTSFGSVGGGPDYFTVVSKDGTTMEFGRSSTSKFYTDDGTKVMMWRINKIIDINGNYIEFEYDNSYRESRITKIKYTGHTSGKLPYNEINFQYSERSDKNTVYDGGYTMQSRYLLWQIQVVSETEVFKTYQMDYGKNAHSASYLKFIQEFASDGSKLNDTRFKYGENTSPFVETLNSDNITLSSKTLISNGDFDGDGLTDFLVSEYELVPGTTNVYNTNLKIKKRTLSSTTYNTICSLSFSGSGVRVENALKKAYYTQRKVIPQFSDFNGDGRDDIIVSNYNTTPISSEDFVNTLDYIHIYYANADGSVSPSPSYIYTPPSIYSAIIKGGDEPKQENYLQIGDFDGDGSSDFITMLGGAIYFHSPRKSITNKSIAQVNLNSGTIPSSAMSLVFDMLFKEADDIFVVNMDGDAKSDLMVVTNGTTRIFTLNFEAVMYDLHLNQIGADLGYPTTWHDINLGDFNGDGKTDILTGSNTVPTANWSIGYSNGKSFVGEPFIFEHPIGLLISGLSVSHDKIVIADFNGDGKSDILDVYSSTTSNYEPHLYTSNGLSFDYQNPSPLYNVFITDNVIPGDFNGDSKSEIFFRGQDMSTSVFHTLFNGFTPFDKSHLLEKVTDGFNRTTEFEYEPLTKGTGSGTGDFYVKGTGETYPVNNVQYPLYVATSMITPDGIGGSSTTNFKYENLRLHRGGRGLLGFEKVKSVNAVANIKTESIYDLNRTFYVPYLKTTKTFLNSTGRALSQTDNTFDFIAKPGSFYPGYSYTGMLRPGGKSGFIQQAKSSVEQDLLKGVVTTSSNTFDTYGNITYSSTTTTGGSLTATSSTTSTYITTGGSPIPNRPSETITSNKRGSQPTVSTKNEMTYYPNGLLNESKSYPTTAPYYFVKNHFVYDAYGNLTLSSKNTNISFSPHTPTTKYEYDSKGRFVTSEENTFGHKKDITTHKFWGKPLSVTDFNGLITTYTYNSWGKLTSSTVPTSTSASYTINYSDGWDLGINQLYYTYTQDPSSPDVKVWHDYLGRPIKTKQETFGGAWTESVSTYDAKGNVATSTNNYLPTETPLTTTNTYDAYNRLASSTNVFGSTSYVYDPGSGIETTTISLPDGKVKKSVVDAVGKLIKSSNGIAGVVHYEYDSWGNEISTSVGTDMMGYHTLIQKEYDEKGMLRKMIDQDAGTTTYDYNPFGQLRFETDPKGKMTGYDYDKAGRVTHKTFDGNHVLYEYYGNIKDYALQKATAISTIGDLVEDYYDYAIGGGITKHIKTTNGVAIEKQFTYDSYNNPLTTDYINSGFKTRNYYDVNGFLQKITTNLTGNPATEKLLYEGTAMNGNGQITNFKRVDGLNASVNYHYGIANHFVTAGIQDLSTSFNYANGNVMSRFDNITQTREDFTYDAIDRLIKAEAQKLGAFGVMHVPLTMSYDGGFWGSFGQIKSKSDVGAYSYGGFPRNAVKSVSDPATIISHETQDITYNTLNKAQKITDKIGTNYYEEKFVYDGNQDRAYSQQSQGAPTPGTIVRKRWYMGDFEIDQKLTGTAKTYQLHYITSDAGLVGIVVEESGSYKYYAAYTDHLGSIVTLTDDAATVVAKQSYDPWGRERNPDTWGYMPTVTAGGGTPTPPEWLYRGYTGHEMLPEYGLINMNGRMYDPMNGRMMRPDNYVQDPSNSQSYNRYSYCWNNPLKYTDPTGDYVFVDDLIAAAIGGTINWAVNGCRFDGKGLGYFGVGAAAGTLGLYGPAGWAAGGAILGAGNAKLGGGNGEQVMMGAVTGVFSGLIGGATGQWATSNLASPLISGLKIGSPILSGAINGAVGGAAGGFAGGFTGGLMVTGDVEAASKMGLQGAMMGGAIGAAAGTVNGIRYARKNGLNPLTGANKNAEIAASWQGNETYPGIDNWRNITLKEGTYVAVGEPYPGNFYTTMNGVARSELMSSNLWSGLQVASHRPNLGIYMVTHNTPAAFGLTYSNTNFGAGGYPQLYISNTNNLIRINTISLK
jgi:RHS repeat-associated protein